MNQYIYPMFTGIFTYAVDTKGRVSIPVPYRDVLEGRKCYPLDNMFNDMPVTEMVPGDYLDKLSDKFLRNAAHQIGSPLKIDNDGRIVLDAVSRRRLEVFPSDKVTFFGMWHSFGICSSNNWDRVQSYLLKRKNDAPTLRLGN